MSLASREDLTLADLRGDGPIQIGASPAVAHDSNHAAGRSLSAATFADVPEADRFLYQSRFTAHLCAAIFDRAIGKLHGLRVTPLIEHADFLEALVDYDILLTRPPARGMPEASIKPGSRSQESGRIVTREAAVLPRAGGTPLRSSCGYRFSRPTRRRCSRSTVQAQFHYPYGATIQTARVLLPAAVPRRFMKGRPVVCVLRVHVRLCRQQDLEDIGSGYRSVQRRLPRTWEIQGLSSRTVRVAANLRGHRRRVLGSTSSGETLTGSRGTDSPRLGHPCWCV